MRSLVVYYSRTGTTRKIAELAAKDLAADVVEIRASGYGPGWLNYFRAARDSLTGKFPDIAVSGPAPDPYNFVLLAAPVWAGHAAPPIRAYLARNKNKFKRAAFVLTCGGNTPPKAFEEMSADGAVKPEQTFVLREKEIKALPGLPLALASFLSSIKLRQAA